MLVAALSGTEPAASEDRVNPYKGLQAFDETDAADFFGRAELVDEIVTRLGRDDLRGRLVLVVGGSGSGKSSVVRAGLLPRIRRGDVPGSRQWFITTMLPGSSPFKELAESMRRVAVADVAGLAEQLAEEGGIDRVLRRLVPGGGQLLLVVDQFEELFTLAGEHDQRAFLDGLVHAVAAPDSRLRVVATLRADFYDRPLAVQPFGSVVHEATVTIAAMLPAELEAAVVEPAQRVGGGVERALVAELVNAVADEPAALPSLQFTLYELAERSPDKRLTLAAYHELGGVAGAIASRAELLYRALDDDERAAVRQMFDRLVVDRRRRRAHPAARHPRRADRSRLGRVDGRGHRSLGRGASAHPRSPSPDTCADRRAGARGAAARVAPPARLDRRGSRRVDGARPRARGDEHVGRTRPRPGRPVPRGAARGRPRRRRRPRRRPPGGRAGVPRCQPRASATASSATSATRVARQARANRRLRVQLAVIAVALVVALVGGFLALDQRRDAQRERRVATARELAAAADANIADDPERSMLLALAAVDETRSTDGNVLPEAEAALHRAVSSSRILLSVPGVGGGLDWSADGTFFVPEGPEESGLVDIRDATTGESLRSWKGHDIDVNDVVLSNDGSMLATVGDDGALRVWDPATGDELVEVKTQGTVYGPSFSPDGSKVAAVWNDELVRVVDIASGEIVAEIDGVRTPRSAPTSAPTESAW